MRVVVDTNVLLPAVLFEGSVAEKVMDLMVTRGDDRLASGDIIEELVRVLRRDFERLSEEEREDAAATAAEFVYIVVPVAVEHDTLRDKADLHVLGCVTAAKADILLTYDKDLLALDSWEGARILTPNQLLHELGTDQHL